MPDGWKAFSTVIVNEVLNKHHKWFYLKHSFNLEYLCLYSFYIVVRELQAEDLLARDKIAAFDFDGCLVKTSVQRYQYAQCVFIKVICTHMISTFDTASILSSHFSFVKPLFYYSIKLM